MFNKIFRKEKKEFKSENHILIAALLIHAAKIDDKFTEIEKKIIKKAIINLFKLTEVQAEEILKKAESKDRESNQIVEFTKEIKNNSMEFRLKIIEILWKIVYSDGTKDDFESNLIRRVCGLLYVSDKDSGIIKSKIINSNK